MNDNKPTAEAVVVLDTEYITKNQALITVMSPIIMEQCMQTIAKLARQMSQHLRETMPATITAEEALLSLANSIESTNAAVWNLEDMIPN